MRVEDPPRQALVEAQRAGAVRERRLDASARSSHGAGRGDLLAQRARGPSSTVAASANSAASSRTIGSFWIRGNATGVASHSRSASRPASVSRYSVRSCVRPGSLVEVR